MNKKYAPRKSSERKQVERKGISAHAQRQRLLAALHEGPVTTLAARLEHEFLHPAARVQELREQGLNIVTHWQTIETIPEARHRVARYVLMPGTFQGRAA